MKFSVNLRNANVGKRICCNNGEIGVCPYLENLKCHLKCRGKKRHPRPDRIESFKKQNNLSLKEGTKLSVAQYNAKKNPFVIYHFYGILGKSLTQLDIENLFIVTILGVLHMY